MAQVRLRWDETRRDELPDVCMRCGAPADTHRTRTFSWHPQWVHLLLLGGVLPFLIVALILTKRMRVEVPFCAAHKNHWLVRNAVVWTVFVGLIGLGVGAAVLMDQNGPGGNDPVGGYLCGATVVGLFVWLVTAAILQGTSIRPLEVTTDDVTLTRVARGFVDALRDQRDARRAHRREDYDDKDDEDDSDHPRRRRRYREDDNE